MPPVRHPLALVLLAAAALAAQPPILTPPPSPAPRINGAMVFGVRPGSPFLYTIAASGDRPMTFSARGLPKGLALDSAAGRISGKLTRAGEHRVVLRAENARGHAERTLRIVAGDRLALTPPMGWNSWYCWSESVSDEKVRASAKALVEKGLVNYGWTYVNLDDCWQGARGGRHRAIQGNERFPDMPGLVAYIHSLGLKAGLYSTPWIGSYAGFIGGSAPSPDGDYSAVALPPAQRLQPFQFFGRWPNARKMGLQRVGEHWFVDADARQWAEWGIDFVKFDWKPNDVPTAERIRKALDASGRDMLLSLSNEAPFEHAADWARLTHMWRTTGDIADTWEAASRIGFSQDRWAPFAGPGRWIDPDMLQVGSVGVPNTFVRQLRPSRLTPDEQYSQVSLWALIAAPLILSCDIESMDAFTLGLLTNAEVIDVNQDPLGAAAMPAVRRGPHEVWVKRLEDGARAAGLFNRADGEETVKVRWADLGLQGPQTVRDLWRQKDLGLFPESFETTVPAHGVALVKIAPGK
jgi:alpha-galactosidase